MTELIKNWQKMGCKQAAVAGIYREDEVKLAENVDFYPVYFHSGLLPFSIAGMSDEMPYESTRYRDFDEEMFRQFSHAFRMETERAVHEFQPDVIVCHHLYLLTALVREWFPHYPLFAISHGSDLRQISTNSLQRDFIRGKICLLDGIFALQETHKEEILRVFGCEKERIQVVGVGYNEEIFCPGKKTDLNKRKYTIVYAGKISRKKGVESLLRAVGSLPFAPGTVTLKLAGGAGNETEYRRILELAEKQDYEIQLLGPLSQKSLAEVFRQSQVFVLPSFFEGLALVNMEAMACGCHVVSSNIPGMKAWYDRHVPGHRISFVELPRMKNTDEPYEEDLPKFEKDLAKAITEKLEQKELSDVELSACSWKAVAGKVLETITKVTKRGKDL